jgi:Bacterial lectin
MRCGLRYASFLVVFALMLGFGAVSSAQQIRFEDFSNTNYAMQYLHQNYSQNFSGQNPPSPYLATYQGNSVLRLTEGTPKGPEASTVYFNVEQPLTAGFNTWFRFQTHNPTQCCNPGDGVAFIIQNAFATDKTQGATGTGIGALGAGGNTNYPNQGGALGYSGIANSLVVEFDILQDPWDPNSNHIAVQSCGAIYNSPVHLQGNYTIGNNQQVKSCLLNQSQQSISSAIPMIASTCKPPGPCADGALHDVVILYTPPPKGQANGTGQLQIWFDPPFTDKTHHIVVPGTPPTISVPLTIEKLLYLDTTNCPPGTKCSAWVGFTASQPSDATAQDILGWDFSSNQITQPVPPGGIENLFDFGPHQYGVTYPNGFIPPVGLLMTVTATPVERLQFYQTRLLGTMFANEQCIVYQGIGGQPQHYATGNCLLYTVTCQLNGQDVTCPQELMCDPINNPGACIDTSTTFFSMDPVTSSNADYLEAPSGTNQWCSIFYSYTNQPVDGTTSGKGTGFSDLIATFRPTPSGGKPSLGAACPP